MDEAVSSNRAEETNPASKLPGRGVLRTFAALRHRNYRLFWLGQLTSLIGTWMQTVAQGWLVLELTNSPFALGLVGAAQFGPVLVLSLFGGITADRFPKRKLLVVTQSSALVLALLLAILTSTGRVQLWHVLLLALGLGIVHAFDMPIRQSFVVEMVGKEDLSNAIALNSTIFNGARIIGPSIAGLLIGWVGLAVCFYVNAASYLAVIAGLLAMRLSAVPVRSHLYQSVWQSLAMGFGFIRRTPTVWMAIVQVALLGLFGMNFNVIAPVLARDVFGMDATGYGALMSAMGAGSLLGALTIATFGQRLRIELVFGAAIATGAMEIALAWVKWFPVAVVLMVAIGFFFLAITATANTLIQTLAPHAIRGRVVSVYVLVWGGVTPLGSLWAGAAADVAGTIAPLLVGGLVCILVGIGGWRVFVSQQSRSSATSAAPTNPT